MTFSKCPLNALLENVKKNYQRWQYSQDMNKYVKTTWNWNQHFQEYFNKRSLWMMECPDVFMWPKGVSEKLLIWFFAAVKMQIISKILLTIFGVKITNFDSFYSIFDSKLPFLARNWVFDPKIIDNIFKNIFFFMAAKNYTRNFVDTLFGPDFGKPSNVIPRCPFHQTSPPLKESNFTNYS